MNSKDDGDHITDIRSFLKKRDELVRSGSLDQVRVLLDERYGKDTNQRHAAECELKWDCGYREEALQDSIYRLKCGEYTVDHILMATRYSLILNNIHNINYLYNSFKSNINETSSIYFIEYAYRKLNNMEIDDNLKRIGWMMT
ncbi:hypothetical protein [Mesorhizobium huakuii]|uniref:Uncharacterized protein n=1 Tax=Mesorhizobium huakuii TaxID=28104 RepID=A0ABZ0VS36_9HYPH|nr:hypothetical protein [Mesorhizobium huakuii]WQB99235.1 hypothetical protein U0R22_003411 [Mesorhizobium huakuii]